MMNIPEFGGLDDCVGYILRPGGYAVILNAEGKVAVVATPLGLALPGGGQNQGESPEEAAVRETLEECGLHIRIEDQLGMADELVFADDENIHYRKRCVFFLAAILSEVAGAGESDHELVWLSPAEAAAKLLHGSQRWAVAEACRRRKL